MSDSQRRGSGDGKVAEGDQLPAFVLPVTSTVIVAGAIASRDFMPAHHDTAYARAQGAPERFRKILTTHGYVSRIITDWAGPEAMIRKIAIRLGGPAIPGLPLHFSGEVARVVEEAEARIVEVSVRAANDLGDHATGTVVVSMPHAS